MELFRNKLILFVLISIVANACSESLPDADPYAGPLPSPHASPFAEPEGYADPEADPSILSSMFERGEALVRQFLPTGLSIAGALERFIPTPENVFGLGKHLVFELPQDIVMYAVQAFCSSAVANNVLRPQKLPNMADMNFVFKGPNGDIVANLNDSEKLWNHSDFKKDRDTVMIITGWNSNVNNTNVALDVLYNAYKKRENINFVYFDTAQFVDTLYSWSAFNTKGVGEIIGEALTHFVKYVPVEKIHLVGHSLGAHICGYAGRTFTNLTDKYIPRITGLDPARPCFNQGEKLDGLDRGDAEFVDIIHSNAGALGKKTTLGDVDFWPNGRSSLQPGCWTLLCSHSRSYEYYAESVVPGNENDFMAVRCSSYASYKQGRCEGKAVPMGFATPKTARGDFYLKTRLIAPFGYKKVVTEFISKAAEIFLDN